MPSATIVLLRDGADGPEVLLLRRNRRAGFVPETYVFPGGRVDPTDSDRGLLALTDELTVESAAERLGIPAADPPAFAYYVAALREAFEETGILVGRFDDGSTPPTAADDPSMERLRNDLMEGRLGFRDVLQELHCRISCGAVEYFAHWITPRRQPRRYDTRFFAARVARRSTPVVDMREMTDARWVAPERALHDHGRGELPMILPTVRTLQRLSEFPTADEALAALGRTRVVTVLPPD